MTSLPPAMTNLIDLNHYFPFTSSGFSSKDIQRFNIEVVEKNHLPFLTKEHFMTKGKNGSSFLENFLSFPFPNDPDKIYTFNLLFKSLINIFHQNNPVFLNDSIINLHQDIQQLAHIENLIVSNLDNTSTLKEIFSSYFSDVEQYVKPQSQTEALMPLTIFALLSKRSPDIVSQLISILQSDKILPPIFERDELKTILINVLTNSIFDNSYSTFDNLDYFSSETESFKCILSRYVMKTQNLIPIHGKYLDLYQGLPEKYKNLTYSEQQKKEKEHKKLVNSLNLHDYLPLKSNNIKKFEIDMLQNKKLQLLTKAHFYHTHNELSFIESLLSYPIPGSHDELFCLSTLINQFYSLEDSFKKDFVSKKICDYIQTQFDCLKNNQSFSFKHKILHSIDSEKHLKEVIQEYYGLFHPDVNTISFKEHLIFSSFICMIKSLIEEKSISQDKGEKLFSLFYLSDETHPGYINLEYRHLLINMYTDFLSITPNVEQFVSIEQSSNIYIDYLSSVVGQNLILEYLDQNKIKTRYEKLLTKIEDNNIQDVPKMKI